MSVKVTSLAVGVAVGALVAAAAGGSSPSAESAVGVIRIADQQLSVARVDVGARGTSPGDTQIVTSRLFTRRIPREPIGHAELVCTFVDSRRLRMCRGTYHLPRGKLVVGGSLEFMQFYDMAVLGGTGLYADARGTLTVTRTATKPIRSLVIFRLVG